MTDPTLCYLQLISDLTEQNQRLTQELREVGETERELRDQIQRQDTTSDLLIINMKYRQSKNGTKRGF